MEEIENILGDYRAFFADLRRRIASTYITFDNNRTVKFYRYSLQDVVEKEGRRFIPW
jgi:hypothetical protein